MVDIALMDLTTHILVVDDDRGLRDLIGAFLASHGYSVALAEDGAAMRTEMIRQRPDLIVLDIMMPGEDGLSVLRTMNTATRPPVIMLSVIGTDVDRIVGLEMGADDYLAKPCNPRELLARIRTVLRRHSRPPIQRPAMSPAWRFERWQMDPVSRELRDPDGVLIPLSDGEFRMLMVFAEHPRRVLTRDFILESMRGHDAEQFDRAIDVQVSRLRKRLSHSGTAELIRTVRHEGYMFTAPVSRD
jgi:two-component system OmpR family response regulator